MGGVYDRMAPGLFHDYFTLVGPVDFLPKQSIDKIVSLEQSILLIYLAACMLIGVIVSKRVFSSTDEYWVGGRGIGVSVNSLAIMATLASGGSIVGVMGLGYSKGIPFALALFSGAVVGFPLASVLVANPLRNFGKYTITDFLSFRYPHPAIQIGVPLIILSSFTVYIVAQLKAAGITSEALLGLPYHQSVILFTIVFIVYVSFGGMVAVTWTDMFQGGLMVIVVVGTGFYLLTTHEHLNNPLITATTRAPELGLMKEAPLSSMIGSFVIWAAAISVMPHIVMRVYSAKNSQAAKLSLNIAVIIYSILIISSLLIIVPVGKILFPVLDDADMVFLKIIESSFSPVMRGCAVAAIMAAVMSTTDALLLACSSAVSHDLLGYVSPDLDNALKNRIRIYCTWLIGLVAMVFAFDPPPLITLFYSASIGVLCAGLFIPTIAGIWWKKTNTMGGVSALLVGVTTYLIVQFNPDAPPLSAILFALPASLLGLLIGNRFGINVTDDIIEKVSKLHV